MLQCGHDHSVMERSQRGSICSPSMAGFNVAMTIQSWKEVVRKLNAEAELRLQCGHDHSVMERCNIYPVFDRFPMRWLQCGHDHSVMESIGLSNDEASAGLMASMWP